MSHYPTLELIFFNIAFIPGMVSPKTSKGGLLNEGDGKCESYVCVYWMGVLRVARGETEPQQLVITFNFATDLLRPEICKLKHIGMLVALL